MPSRPAALRRAPLPWVLLTLTTAVLATAWFGRISLEALSGDDVILVAGSREPGGFASSFWHSWVQDGGQKYRPIVTAVQAVLCDLLGGDQGRWVLVLTALETANAVGAAYLAWLMSGRRPSVAVGVAAAMVTSRFNTYFVWQTYGVMEGLALSFTLIAIGCARQAWRTGATRWLAGTVLAAGAAAYSHERYLCLLALTAAVAVLGPVLGTWRRRLAWLAAAFAVPVSNYVVKVVLLDIDFFAGNAGEDVRLTPKGVAQFGVDGLQSLAGYTTGPTYLVGADASFLGPLPKVMTALFLLCAGALAVAALRSDLLARRDLRPWLVGAGLFGGLLLMACISARQEQRWLYTPQVVLLLGLAFLSVRAGGARWGRVTPSALLLVALGTSVVVDLQEARHVEGIYFLESQRLAQSVFDQVVQDHRGELATTTVFLLTERDDVRDFDLGGGAFVALYAPEADVRVVDNRRAARRERDLREHTLWFQVLPGQVVPVPAPVGP